MPALSYKSQFVANVASGSKQHSIRAWRKRPFKLGDTLMHYCGMRTKQCRKIRPDTLCVGATPIEVNARLRYVILSEGSAIYSSGRLSKYSLRALAAMDGFRSLSDFWQFFEDAHGGILCGQLVEWNPFVPLSPVRSSPAAAGKREPRGRRGKASAAAAPASVVK